MYQQHFNLRELPFNITPDTSFYFPHSSHQQALEMLVVAIQSGEGFIKVTGEVGTGKTLLCRKLMQSLDKREFLVAYLPNPYLEPLTLLLALADELRIPHLKGANQHQLLTLVHRRLIETYAARKRVVVALDEAQAMPRETLEALRLLTNMETERRKLLQVVLFGQPELDERLNEPGVRQLRQRIGFSCRIEPLSLKQADLYLAHRMDVAGYVGPRFFSRAAVRRIHSATGGVPRLINIIAHKSMMAAFGDGSRHVGLRHVRAAVRDTESLPGRRAATPTWVRWAFFGLIALALTAIIAGLLLSRGKP